jgi:hypothetical protein
VQQVKTAHPRASLEVVLAVLAGREPDLKQDGDWVDVVFDAGHIAMLLDAASSEEGSSGDRAPWADEACWRVYETLKVRGVSWLDACIETAEAAGLIDKIANEGLDGRVRFLQGI